MILNLYEQRMVEYFIWENYQSQWSMDYKNHRTHNKMRWLKKVNIMPIIAKLVFVKFQVQIGFAIIGKTGLIIVETILLSSKPSSEASSVRRSLYDRTLAQYCAELQRTPHLALYIQKKWFQYPASQRLSRKAFCHVWIFGSYQQATHVQLLNGFFFHSF